MANIFTRTLLGEPCGQEHDDAREEACLGDAQQEPKNDEDVSPWTKAKHAETMPPGNGDAGEPHLRSELGEQQVAGGDLEQGIADEEDTGAQRVSTCGNTLIHFQRGFGEATLVRSRKATTYRMTSIGMSRREALEIADFKTGVSSNSLVELVATDIETPL